jgi:hypothetical protein
MTQTTTTDTEAAPDAGAGRDIPIHPTDILIALIVACLAPMFLCASGGDVGFARMAAMETLNAYRARNQADLLAVAQIVGFGLAVLGSLSLSMAEDISLTMTLRLRGNANALHRSAEQLRRARETGGASTVPNGRTAVEHPASPPVPPPDPAREAALVASVAATQRQAAAVLARINGVEQPQRHVPSPVAAPDVSPVAAPDVSPVAARDVSPVAALDVSPVAAPAPSPVTVAATSRATAPAASPIAAPATSPTTAAAAAPVAAPAMTEEQQRRAMWASAMADVAAEYTASLASLPPEARYDAAVRATALTQTARTLLSGTPVPPSILPTRSAPPRQDPS